MALATAIAALGLALPGGASASIDLMSGNCAAGISGGVVCQGYRPNEGSFVHGGHYDLPWLMDEKLTPVPNLAGMATDIAVASDHNCAVVEGAAYCWGTNRRGQLGDGTTDPSEVPLLVPGFESGVVDIAATYGSTCAVKSGGVSCWGAGISSQESSSTPQPVAGLEHGASTVALGPDIGCATVDGKAICWGTGRDRLARNEGDEYGEFAPGVAAGLDEGVTSITIAGSSVCAVVSGSARCWGRNDDGELGDGTTTATHGSESRQVTGLTSGVTAISMFDGVACAIVSGAANCWGSNLNGLHGDGTYETESGKPSTPVQVSGLDAGVDGIGMTYFNVCARQNGAFLCWGKAVPALTPGWYLTPVEIDPPLDAPKPMVSIRTPVSFKKYLVNTIPVNIYSNVEGPLECKLDDADFGPCPSTLSGLSEGHHAFYARAVDEHGVETRAGSGFDIDTKPPTITINGAQDEDQVTDIISRTLSFSTDEPLAFAQCVVDDFVDASCAAGTDYVLWFWPGTHTVKVTATDKAGRVSTVTAHFTITAVPPPPPPPPAGPSEPTAPAGPSEPSAPPSEKPFATQRAETALALSLRTTGTFKKGTRRLTVLVRVVNTDLHPGSSCNGVVRIAIPRLSSTPRDVKLALDGNGRCVASRTLRVKRAAKGRKVEATAEFFGNSVLLPAKRTGSKHL